MSSKLGHSAAEDPSDINTPFGDGSANELTIRRRPSKFYLLSFILLSKIGSRYSIKNWTITLAHMFRE